MEAERAAKSCHTMQQRDGVFGGRRLGAAPIRPRQNRLALAGERADEVLARFT
jgi:hypothetical protein